MRFLRTAFAGGIAGAMILVTFKSVASCLRFAGGETWESAWR